MNIESKQPNSRHCFVCGVENPLGLHLHFYNSAPGELTAEFCLDDNYQGYPGVTHGGIIAAILDEAAGRVYLADPAAPRFMYTARLTVNYRQSVPMGVPLRLTAKAGVVKRRTATATSAILDAGGAILADADVLLVDIPGPAPAASELEAVGWKIYPDEEEHDC